MEEKEGKEAKAQEEEDEGKVQVEEIAVTLDEDNNL